MYFSFFRLFCLCKCLPLDLLVWILKSLLTLMLSPPTQLIGGAPDFDIPDFCSTFESTICQDIRQDCPQCKNCKDEALSYAGCYALVNGDCEDFECTTSAPTEQGPTHSPTIRPTIEPTYGPGGGCGGEQADLIECAPVDCLVCVSSKQLFCECNCCVYSSFPSCFSWMNLSLLLRMRTMSIP